MGLTSFDLFVTSVEKDGIFLKIWGQKDHSSATNVERAILQYAEAFDNGVGLPDPRSLQVGQMCCARYNDGSYYRARILGVHSAENSARVYFLDYGNADSVPFSSIRIPATAELFDLAPQASSFILSDVTGTWDVAHLGYMLEVIGYEMLKCIIVRSLGPLNDTHLLKLYHGGRDYAETLCEQGFATPVSQTQFEVMVNAALSDPGKLSIIQPLSSFGCVAPYPSNPMLNYYNPHVMNPMWPRMMAASQMQAALPNYPMASHLSTMGGARQQISTPVLPQGIRKMSPLSSNTSGEQRSLDLKPEAEFKALISHVEDLGCFAVQFLRDDKELNRMMADLNKNPLTPLQPPLIPGTKCVGRYSDGTQCRAVIVGIVNDKCKLYYIDFGNTEMVDSKDLFELPSDFLNIKPMAVQFALGGLGPQPTDEMKATFKGIVLDKEVCLRVVAPTSEEPAIKLYCELYINDINVKELVNNELVKRHAKPKLRNIALPEAGTEHKVIVSFVTTLNNFYVQLASKKPDLDIVMASMNKYCSERAERMQPSDITIGAACCALFHGDGKWYRAYIVDPDLNALTVFYVDFGNEEKVALDDVRQIDSAGLTRMRTLAIPCVLSGFEDNEDEQLAIRFEELVLEKTFKMKVIHLKREKPCVLVRLFTESGEDISSLLKPSEFQTSSVPESVPVQKYPPVMRIESDIAYSEKPAVPSDRRGFDRKESGGREKNRDERGEMREQRDDDRGRRGPSVKYQADRGQENILYKPKDCDWGSTSESSKGYFFHCDRTSTDASDYPTGSRSEKETNRSSTRPSEDRGRDVDRSSSKTTSRSVNNSGGESWGDESSTSSSNLLLSLLTPSIGTSMPVYMVYSHNPSDFYVQAKDSTDLSALMERIAEEYSKGGEALSVSNIKEGAACMAQFAEDGSWYRAIVRNVSGNSVDVFFPDYGNSQTVANSELKKIKPDMLFLKGQAIHCMLMGTPSNGWSDDQITEFSLLSNIETLEATFVDTHSDLFFKVVLKDTSIDKTVNESFGATQESILAPTSHVSSIPCFTLMPGSVHDILVSWFISPSKFFVQLKSNMEEFKCLMKNIQKGYVNKDPICVSSPGQMVIGRFKDDKSLYRAEVKVLRGNKFGVHFVDYGNRSLVEQIYGLEHQYASLPCQALACCLKGVLPLENEWPKNNDAILKLLNGNISCTIHGEVEGAADGEKPPLLVSLSCDGVDFAQELIDKQLARAENFILPCSAEPEESDRVEPVDVQMLIGQLIPCVVKAAAETTLFVNLEPDLQARLHEEIQSFCQDSQKLLQLPSSEVSEHYKCLVYSGESKLYKRAKICDVTKAAGITIQSIDDGYFEEVSADQVFVLPEELAVLPPLAVRCIVAGADVEVAEKLNTLVNQNVRLSVQAVLDASNDQKLEVNMVDAYGQPFPFLPSDGCDAFICPMPILRKRMKVFVTHSAGPSVWLQQAADSDKITGILDQLFVALDGVINENQDWKEGNVCAAKSEDGNWYRGVIESQTDEGCLVQYLDYGNSETISKEYLRKLPDEFFIQSAFAVQASLPIITNASVDELITSMTLDKMLSAVLVKVEGRWLVELLEGDVQLSAKIVLTGKASHMENNPFPALLKPDALVNLKTGEMAHVYVSSIESPSEIYVQLAERTEELELLQGELQALSESMKPCESFPDVGCKCIALYSDEIWYRGKMQADKRIHFIDYGNYELVDLSSLRELPTALSQVNDFAVQCSLLPPEGKIWSDETTARLTELLIDCEGNVRILLLNETGQEAKEVDILLDNKSVADMLAMEGLLKDSSHSNTEENKSLKAVFVSHLVSPAEFWVTENDMASKLDELTDLESGDELSSPPVGTLCAALFEEFEQWYRARVESNEDNVITVRFIDYGNSAVPTQIKSLSSKHSSLPPLAKLCSLYLPSNVTEWSESSKAKFVEISGDGQTVFNMELLIEGNPAIVNLTLDGKKIDDELLSLCSTVTAAEESTVKACIVSATSPADFFLHLLEDFDSIQQIQDELINAGSFEALSEQTPGTMCAALFSDDGVWYRARIIKVLDNGCEVVFVDYGNSSVSSELRSLPERLQGAPMAKHCTLPHVVWSDVAVANFVELADGETEFDIEFLSSDEPSVVNVVQSGRDVTREMAELSNVDAAAVEALISSLRSSRAPVGVAKGNRSEEKVALPLAEHLESQESNVLEEACEESSSNLDRVDSDLPRTSAENHELGAKDQNITIDETSIDKDKDRDSADKEVLPGSSQEGVLALGSEDGKDSPVEEDQQRISEISAEPGCISRSHFDEGKERDEDLTEISTNENSVGGREEGSANSSKLDVVELPRSEHIDSDAPAEADAEATRNSVEKTTSISGEGGGVDNENLSDGVCSTNTCAAEEACENSSKVDLVEPSSSEKTEQDPRIEVETSEKSNSVECNGDIELSGKESISPDQVESESQSVETQPLNQKNTCDVHSGGLGTASAVQEPAGSMKELKIISLDGNIATDEISIEMDKDGDSADKEVLPGASQEGVLALSSEDGEDSPVEEVRHRISEISAEPVSTCGTNFDEGKERDEDLTEISTNEISVAGREERSANSSKLDVVELPRSEHIDSDAPAEADAEATRNSVEKTTISGEGGRVDNENLSDGVCSTNTCAAEEACENSSKVDLVEPSSSEKTEQDPRIEVETSEKSNSVECNGDIELSGKESISPDQVESESQSVETQPLNQKNTCDVHSGGLGTASAVQEPAGSMKVLKIISLDGNIATDEISIEMDKDRDSADKEVLPGASQEGVLALSSEDGEDSPVEEVRHRISEISAEPVSTCGTNFDEGKERDEDLTEISTNENSVGGREEGSANSSKLDVVELPRSEHIDSDAPAEADAEATRNSVEKTTSISGEGGRVDNENLSDGVCSTNTCAAEEACENSSKVDLVEPSSSEKTEQDPRIEVETSEKSNSVECNGDIELSGKESISPDQVGSESQSVETQPLNQKNTCDVHSGGLGTASAVQEPAGSMKGLKIISLDGNTATDEISIEMDKDVQEPAGSIKGIKSDALKFLAQPGKLSSPSEASSSDILVTLDVYPSVKCAEEDCEGASVGQAKAHLSDINLSGVEPGVKTYRFDCCEHTEYVEVDSVSANSQNTVCEIKTVSSLAERGNLQ